MSASSARQWQRIDYQAPVQLRLQTGDAVGPVTLHARAVNVSERGIQVRTKRQLRIGETVTCSMLLEGRPTALSGRVRWARSTEPGFKHPGAGIEFDPVSEGAGASLRQLVSSAARGEQPVELALPGMTQPIHARAFTTDSGLHITAALPLLSREAPVEFRFHDGGPSFKGHIANVTVRERDRTPYLELELAVHAREAPRFRHYTMYDDPAYTDTAPRFSGEWDDEPSPGEDSTSAQADSRDARSLPPVETPRPARHVLGTPLPVLPKSMAARMPRAALAALVTVGAALIASLMAWIVTAPSALVLRHEDATARAPRPVQVVPPPAAMQIAQPERVAVPLTPTVQAGDGATEVLIPLDGSLQGARVMRWASPVAVIVDLPQARLTTAPGTYFPQVGQVTRLTLAQSGDTTRVRAFLGAAPSRHEVLLREGRLVLRVWHDLRGQTSANPR